MRLVDITLVEFDGCLEGEVGGARTRQSGQETATPPEVQATVNVVVVSEFEGMNNLLVELVGGKAIPVARPRVKAAVRRSGELELGLRRAWNMM